MIDDIKFIVRQAKDSDIPFIIDSWLKSYAEKGIEFSSKESYFKSYPQFIKDIIESSYLYIVCLPEDSDTILGWMCFEPRNNQYILHYIYVKHPFRKFGIAKYLFKIYEKINSNKQIIYSHKTNHLDNIISISKDNWIYNLKDKLEFNPYLFFSKNQ